MHIPRAPRILALMSPSFACAVCRLSRESTATIIMDFWFICSSLESYLAAPSSLGKVHIRSRFELEQSCPCKPKPLDSTNKETRKQTFDHTSKSDQASWYDARSIEIIPRGRPPFLGWLCGYMLMNSRDRTPSSWWNLKADPLWLMNSRGGPPFEGLCWWI